MNEERRPFQEPEIVTYERDELVIETVFTGRPHSAPDNESDRRVKRNFGSVRARNLLARLSRLT